MTDSARPRVFITHSWHEAKFAGKLSDELSARCLDVWIDNRSVQAGDRLADDINRGLDWCDVYLPVLSNAALDSAWCREEMDAAIALSNEPGREERPRIVPVLVENCRNKMTPMLKSRLYIDFTGRYADALQELLAKGFGIPGAVRETTQPYQAATSRSIKLGARLIDALLGAAILAILGPIVPSNIDQIRATVPGNSMYAAIMLGVAGAIAGAMQDRRWTVLGVTIIGMVIGFGLMMMDSGFRIFQNLCFGIAAGSVIGAIVGVILKNRKNRT